MGAIWLGRGCIPGTWKNLLAAAAVRQIVAFWRTCVVVDEPVVWPGEPRRPGCGWVDVRARALGGIPAEARACGATAAD